MGANPVYNTPAYAILALDVVLTTGALLGRIASRKMMKMTLATDDYLTYVAYSANMGLLISGFLLTSSGALSLDDVSHQNEGEKQFTRNAYNSLAILYIFTITFIKCSILFFYRRTFTMFTTWFRYAWWASFVLTLLWTVTCIILLILQGTDKLPKGGFSRLGISITGVVNAFTDCLILGLPAFMISRLKLQMRQKIAIISIFLIGGIASVVSIVRGTIFFINRAHKLNEAYSNYLDIVLTATEASAGLMCACLPLTKPIVVRITRWIQKRRGLDTGHQGWTTMSGSVSKSGVSKQGHIDRIITRVDDYEIQLLPVSPATTGDRDVVVGEAGKTLDSQYTRGSEMQRPWSPQRLWGHDRI